ncbi:MAG: hydrogenase maturation protease [Betaproteobacteria bacterium]|nr:hydrogenase maturation protease [Betaproteobacteria bacterium]
MTRARIICIGNPYQPGDWVGPAVYAALRREAIDPDIGLIDGGLQGLNLLTLMENVDNVVFADTFISDGAPGSGIPQVLREPFAGDPRLSFDHAGGLAYLLQAAPLVVDRLPRIAVVGMDAGAGRHRVGELARLCLSVARERHHAA